MKKLTVSLCLFLSIGQAYAQTDCAAYHKGYFMYADSVGNIFYIQRRNKYQYEYDRKKDVRTQFVVKWKSDCEYTIMQTLTNSKELKKYKNEVRVFRISKRDGENGYYYSCACADGTQQTKEYFLKKITKKEFYDLY